MQEENSRLTLFYTDIECTVLSNPDNGKVDADSTLFGDVAMYTCSIGYRLIGSDQRECLGNSTWSGTSPHCQRKSALAFRNRLQATY